MCTACIHKLTITLMVPLKVVFELELVILLLMIAEVGLTRRLGLNARVCANQHLLDFFGILGWRVANVDAQLTVGQIAVHVVNLPVAFEGVDQTLGVFAYESSWLR